MHLLQICPPETVHEGMLSFLLDKIAMCVHCQYQTLCRVVRSFLSAELSAMVDILDITYLL